MPSDNTTQETSNAESATVSRRRFAQAASAAGVSLGLAGCSGGGGSDGGDTTTTGSDTTTDSDDGGSNEVTLVFNNSLSGKPWDKYLGALRDSGLPDNINIKLSSLPESNRMQQWERWLSSERKKPDLFMIEPQGMRFMYNGQLQKLDSLLKDETKQIINEKMSDTLVNFFSNNGSLYGVPFLFDFSLIQYRKDLVEKAGFNTKGWQTNPLSWEKFTTVMSQTQEQTSPKDGYGWGARTNRLDSAYFEALKSYGGAIWGENGPAENIGNRDVTIDEPAGVDALKMMKGLLYGSDADNTLDGISQCSPQAVLQWGDTPVVNNMSGGNLVGIRNFSWSIPVLGKQKNFGKDLGVMPVPYGVPQGQGKYPKSGGSRSVGSAWHIAINPYSDNVEAAAKVLDAMVTKNSQLTLFEYQGYAPPRTDLYTADRIANMDVIGRYQGALNYAANHIGGAPGLNPLWGREQRFLNEGVRAGLKQEKAPEPALSEAAKTMQDFEAKYKDQY